MLASSLFTTAVAVFASLAAAQTTASESTTTSTSTLTKYITITTCNPDVASCPAKTTSHTTFNSTISTVSSVSVSPTVYQNSTSWTTKKPSTKTTTEVVLPTKPAATSPSSSSPSSVPTGGAGALVIQTGLLLGALGAGMVLMV